VQLAHIARRIARAIGKKDPDSIRSEFYHLATMVDSAGAITMDDVENFFIGTTDSGQLPMQNTVGGH